MRNKIPHCLGCGSEDFTKEMEDKIIKIEEVPKEGFNINTKFDWEEEQRAKKLYTKGIILVVISLLFGILVLLRNTILPFYLFIFMPIYIIALFMIILGVTNYVKHKNEIKRLTLLKYKGVLYKNEYFKVVPLVNNMYKLVVSFRKDNNSKATSIESKPLFATSLYYEDALVDVLVNPNNDNDYYVGFDIY
jgi:hypothetical protein